MTHYRMPSYNPPPGASLGQILYEDKPSSYSSGSAFPAPRYREDTASSQSSSPSNYDRFNSRPPRHGGEMRHAASDGNFNFLPSPPSMPLGSGNTMSPAGSSHPNIAATASMANPTPISFNGGFSPAPGGQVNNNDGQSQFGCMDAG